MRGGRQARPLPLPLGRRVTIVPDVLPPADGLPPGDAVRGVPAYGRRRAAVTALALALLVPLLLYVLNRPGEPDSLGDSVLSGPRLTHGPVCLDLAVDYSGSMTEEAETRDTALAELRTFIDRNLQADDVLASAAFTAESLLTLPPTAKRDLGTATMAGGGPADGPKTLLLPALTRLRESYALSRTTCAAHALIVITDVELGDDPAALRDAFTALRLQRIYWAMPDRADGDLPGIADRPELAGVVARGFDDARGLSLLYGQAIASMTGQELVGT